MVEIYMVIMTLAVVALAIVGVPAFLQVRRAAQDAQETLRVVRQEGIPLLRDLRDTVQHVDELTERVEAGVAQTKQFVQNMGDTGRALFEARSGLGRIIGGLACRSLLFGVGFRAIVAALNRWKQRQHGNTESALQQEVHNGY